MTTLSFANWKFEWPLWRTRTPAQRNMRGFHSLLVAFAATMCNSAVSLADPAHEPYTCSWQAGGAMGGTETMSLVAHDGKLYAGIGYWEDTQPYPGARILVLDSPTAQWRVEHTFSEKVNGVALYKRVAALKEITFRFDGKGHQLSAPVSLMLAANDLTRDVPTADLAVFSRDDSGQWMKMTLPIAGRGIRSLGFYHDSCSGADFVFAGTYKNGFVRGSYDASLPGKIRWSPNPESADPVVEHRIMAFGESGGKLYAFSKPRVYEYAGGASPLWRSVFAYPNDELHYTSGLRGATEINGELFGVLEGLGFESKIYKFFPAVEVLNISHFLKTQLGTDFLSPGENQGDTNIIGAYNNITKVIDPITQQDAWLVGLGFSQKRRCPFPGQANNSWFLARSATGTWTVHEIPSLNFNDPQPCPCAVRTIAVSPFAQDQRQVIYIGFYDTHGLPCHDTAHIFRVGLARALQTNAVDPPPPAKH